MFVRGFKAWCETIAKQQRQKLGLGPSDPLNPRALALQMGVGVKTVNEIPGLDPKSLRTLTVEDPDSWSAFTLSFSGRQIIILNPTHRGGRPASDLTHELAHILIGHTPSRVDIAEDKSLILNTYDRKQEDEANWLAGCLLLPRDALMQIRLRRVNVVEAARKYGVSGEMLQFRLNVTGVNYQFQRVQSGKR